MTSTTTTSRYGCTRPCGQSGEMSDLSRLGVLVPVQAGLTD